MKIDNHKREEWEAHIHFFSLDKLHSLFCEYLDCDKDSITGSNIKLFLETKRVDMDMFAVWLGHIRGDYYGNFSIRKDNNIVQKGKGFHCRSSWWNWALDELPLDWKKIIDSTVNFEDNKAHIGIDIPSGEFLDKVTDINELSGKRFKK